MAGAIIGAVRRVVRWSFAAIAVAMLAACRLDVAVDTTVNADGTGEVVIVGTVDKEVVDRVPGLTGSLSLADATAAGWTVEGPAATEDGGLTVTLRHQFVSVQEAANLLNSIGPAFGDLVFEHTATEDEVTVTMAGTLSLPGGTWDAFGDQALLTSTGGTPFAAQLAESGATPTESMSVDLAVRLPGDVEETSGDRRDGTLVWTAPLDGSVADVSARSVLRPDSGSGWAGPLGTAALVLLVAWLIAGIGLAVMVVRARRRRRNRPLRRLY
jgi:hypothetical protein